MGEEELKVMPVVVMITRKQSCKYEKYNVRGLLRWPFKFYGVDFEHIMAAYSQMNK